MGDASMLPRRIVKETQRLLTEPGESLLCFGDNLVFHIAPFLAKSESVLAMFLWLSA